MKIIQSGREFTIALAKTSIEKVRKQDKIPEKSKMKSEQQKTLKIPRELKNLYIFNNLI